MIDINLVDVNFISGWREAIKLAKWLTTRRALVKDMGPHRAPPLRFRIHEHRLNGARPARSQPSFHQNFTSPQTNPSALTVLILVQLQAPLCMIVLDPRDISGGSPQKKAEFTCRGVKPGTEEYYLLFPRTDVDLESYPVETVGKIGMENPNILSLETAISGIYFILGFNLEVEDITLSHGFMIKHREALLAGKVHSDLNDPRYKEPLIKGVLYYDGQDWTTKPTRVMRAPQ